MDSTLSMSALDMILEVDYWGWFKSTLFYVMLAICAAQTFYPILMIIAMFIRQLGFLAQLFHEVRDAMCSLRLFPQPGRFGLIVCVIRAVRM